MLKRKSLTVTATARGRRWFTLLSIAGAFLLTAASVPDALAYGGPEMTLAADHAVGQAGAAIVGGP